MMENKEIINPQIIEKTHPFTDAFFCLQPNMC